MRYLINGKQISIESAPITSVIDSKLCSISYESAFNQVTKYQDAIEQVIGTEGFLDQAKNLADNSVNKIKTAIKFLREWFEKFKNFVLKIFKFISEKIKALIEKFTGKTDEFTVEEIKIVNGENKSNESEQIPDRKSSKMIWVKFKGKLLPVKLDYEDVKSVILSKGYVNNLEFLDKNKLSQIVQTYIKFMDISKQYIEYNVSPLPNITQSNKIILPISEVQNEEEYIKNVLYNVYSGFKTLATDGPNAICKPLVDAYAKYDVFIQSKLDELEKEIEDPQSTTKDDKQRILTRVSQSKQNIDKCYTDVLKLNIKQSNIVETIMVMTNSCLRLIKDELMHPYKTIRDENKYTRLLFDDGTKKITYNDAVIEITKSEAEYFLKFTGGLGKETTYTIGKENKQEPTEEAKEAARKAIELFSKRNSKIALTSGKDIVLYFFSYKVEKRSEKFYLVLSGNVRTNILNPNLANVGNYDAKIKADLNGLSVLYHVQYNLNTSPVEPLNELNPTGSISKSEGHFYSGKGRVYCSRYPVIKNGTRATKQMLDYYNARVYEIKISDIDKSNVFVDPEHSKDPNTLFSSGRLKQHCFYIETDKPIPVTEVTSKWR